MTMRRDFLAFTAGAVVAKTVLPIAAEAKGVSFLQTSPSTADPDAILIALCATFSRACGEIRRLNATEGCADEDMDAAVEAFWAPIGGIIDTPATTKASIQAKAQAMIGMFANGGVQRYLHQTVEEAASRHEVLAWRLAHEIVAMGDAGVRVA
jgi:hypothetical protein